MHGISRDDQDMPATRPVGPSESSEHDHADISAVDDNSNRFQHTCKRCGEHFPKGRLETLVLHLNRRCSGLTQADRIWISQQQEVEKISKPAKRNHAETFPNVNAATNSGYQAELQPPHAQHQSALETLAEVSGQYSSREDICAAAGAQKEPLHGASTTVAEAIAEQALLAQLQGHVQASAGNAASTRVIPNNESFRTTSHAAQHAHQAGADLAESNMALCASPLVEAASAANRHLEQSSQPFMDSNLFDTPPGQALESFNIPIDMGFRMAGPADGPASELTWMQPAGKQAMPSFGSLVMPQSDPVAGYGILSINARQKPRGRFDDVRRKEVSNIRKQGACIRCRMLKKPCSGETPCKTCAGVESARIWMGKCLRTKLCDEMTMWTTKAFHIRAKAKVTATTAGFQDTGVKDYLKFSCLESAVQVKLPVKKFEAISSDLDRSSNPNNRAACVWVLSQEDVAVDELCTHARQTESLIEAQSPLMEDILRRTQELVTAASSGRVTGCSTDAMPEDHKRSTPGHQSDLPKNVMNLWTLTEILTLEDDLKLCTYEVPDGNPSEDSAALSAEWSSGTPSCDLVHAQLLAAIEGRCSKLAKSILNELERRLLQRQQTSRLATLLSALVLLSCVEHMTGYYRCFDLEGNNAQSNDDSVLQATLGAAHSAEDARTETERTSSVADRSCDNWPPEPAPASIWQQGEQFSDLLTSLLRMRALPPKTKITAKGTLESIREFTMPVSDPQTPKKPNEESKEAADDWLDSLELQAQPLREKRDAAVPDCKDGLDAWRLRYVAKVLLP